MTTETETQILASEKRSSKLKAQSSNLKPQSSNIKAQSSKLLASTQSDLRLLHSGDLKLKLGRISIEGHHSQTQTDNQLRLISGQTVRYRTESVGIISLSRDQTQKMRYVEAKSDQYERSYVCLKFNSILSRATLARFVQTLSAHSSAPSDPILFQHISFFALKSPMDPLRVK